MGIDFYFPSFSSFYVFNAMSRNKHDSSVFAIIMIIFHTYVCYSLAIHLLFISSFFLHKISLFSSWQFKDDAERNEICMEWIERHSAMRSSSLWMNEFMNGGWMDGWLIVCGRMEGKKLSRIDLYDNTNSFPESLFLLYFLNSQMILTLNYLSSDYM